ncbi:MAG: PQQ-binding-like beta-propeller repeat protein [Verrucomicrobiota bacterium]
MSAPILLPGALCLRSAAWICALLLGVCRAEAQAPTKPSENWPCFRGPDRLGIAAPGNNAVPIEWSDTRNILWKIELPGRGASSPIVWEDNVYVTAYDGYGLEKGDPDANQSKLVRHLLCVDRLTGKLRWRVHVPLGIAREHQLSDYLSLHGYASSTPVADESGVYVYFGHSGVFAYDHAGTQRWHGALGDRQHNWGSASSPILHENLLIVHADPESHALLAFDKQSGRRVWSVPTGSGDTWSTPLIVPAGGRHELVFHHSDVYHSEDRTASIGAVDPRTGETLWKCTLLKDYLCPSPVARGGVIYWLGYQKAAAVRAGGKGDVTASHVLWNAARGTEICTPILYDGHLYWVNEASGVAYCANAATGQLAYEQRLEPNPGRLYASGVLVRDSLIYVSRENGAYVVEAGPKFRQLANNRIASDRSLFNGTPAVSRNRMYLRSDRFLYCIGQK